MKSKVVILVLFLGTALALVYFARLRSRPAGGPPPGAALRVAPLAPAPGTKPPPGPRSKISVVFGTEKEAWMRAAVAGFSAEHPEYEIALTAMGSLEAARQILDGTLHPTVWSPADSLVMKLLDADWKAKTGAPLFAAEGDAAPQPLLLTPLVFVIWEDRAAPLLKAGKGDITWKSIRSAVSSNRGWPAVGGKAEWGFVKLGHTDPTRSNSGLQALWSMTVEFFGRGATIGVEQLLRPDYQSFVSAIERGVTRFEPSTGTFMIDMVRFGPSKYDLAVVYESLAIEQIENARGRWQDLRVVYPKLTVWSDHPAAVPQAPWVSVAQGEGGRQLLAYLRTREVQQRALGFGFRPANPDVAIKTGDAENPFVRLAAHGLKSDLPPAAPTPDGAVVRNLIMLWSRLMAGSSNR